MKRHLIKIGILFAIFLAGVAVMSTILNTRQTTENRADLAEASLPLLAIDVGEYQVNRMYAYTEKMQVDFMRDSLTPLNTQRRVAISVRPYDHKIESMTYEIRTSDGSKVVENAKIKNFSTEDGEEKAEFTIGGDLLMNQEYSLCFEMETNRGTYYYYTRVISRAGLNTEAYVEFAQNFYTECLNKESARNLSTYLETDNTRTNSSFTEVDIHSTWDQVTWGSLSPSIYQKGTPVIRDINETTGSVSVDYILTAKDEDGNDEYYQVRDFYRMRYTQARIMLLDFKRTTTEIFHQESQVLTSQGVDLGITDKDITYVTNHTGDIVAFVQAGELWTYNLSAGKLTRVFSFRGEETNDERYHYGAHDMKIVRVGETGDVDFVLYGYMNRGEHEGSMGIGVYHYSNDQNVLEEKVFLPSTISYEFLREDVARLSYVSTDDMLYLLMEGRLYQVNLQEKSYEILQEGIAEDCFVVSSTHGHAAWMEEKDPYATTNITVIDFETAETRRITAAEGTKIRAWGFINEDLVYGVANDGDILTDAGGTQYAMHRICIEDFAGNIIKEYQQDGVYIMDVDVEPGLLALTRAQWTDDGYTQILSDHIMNNAGVEEGSITVATSVSQRKGTCISLNFSQGIQNRKPMQTQSKILATEDDRILHMDLQASEENAYYVYGEGRLNSIHESPNTAIQAADAVSGVVLNRAQQYVWERGNKKDRITIDMGDIPQAVLTGSLDTAALQSELGEGQTVLDLTGCTLDEVLYQVSNMRPVIAKMAEGQTAVIVGYDPYNTILYYPSTGATSYYGINDSTALFESAGNVFISYIEAMN